MAARVRQSVAAHLEEDRRAKLYLLTFTVPHVEGAAALLDVAWRELTRRAPRGHWLRSVCMVLEWTAGRDGRGHPHAHVVTCAPYIDYSEARELWSAACDRAGVPSAERAQVGAGWGAFDAQPMGRGRKAQRSAGDYVAKYVATEATADLMTVEEWARLACYLSGRRTVRTSRGWWRWEPPRCPCCDQRWLRCDLREHRPWGRVEPTRAPWRDDWIHPDEWRDAVAVEARRDALGGEEPRRHYSDDFTDDMPSSVREYLRWEVVS